MCGLLLFFGCRPFRQNLGPPCAFPPPPPKKAAEVVLGTVRDVSLAIDWLKASFLWIRLRANPAHYG